jgi:hypothetical protein
MHHKAIDFSTSSSLPIAPEQNDKMASFLNGKTKSFYNIPKEVPDFYCLPK